MAEPSVVAWNETTIEQVFPGITRQVVHGERQTLVRYVYQPGSVFPIHRHPEEQVTMVIRGRIEFDLAGKMVTLGPGDVAVIPADLPHGARAIGDEVVESFNSLSPRRTASPYSGLNEGGLNERG